MLRNRKVVVVMPAYNAARTIQQTYEEVMSQDIVDLIVVVDDASRDETAAIARGLPRVMVHTHAHVACCASQRQLVTLRVKPTTAR